MSRFTGGHSDGHSVGYGLIRGALLAFASLSALLLSPAAWAEYGLNLPVGVTDISKEVYDLHMVIFYICCGIGVVVFGAILFSIVFHRKSSGHKAAQFHHSTAAEILWTVAPFVILIVMAVPAARLLVKMENTKEADMNLLITGYQWKWKYDYIDHDVSMYSTLAAESNAARQNDANLPLGENYLLEVDKEIVLPVDTKIRLLITAADVIHAWWIPDFSVKKDAIPGFINETWVKINEEGVYRGQCAELCGRDHGFMPIVARVVSKEAFAEWVASQGGTVSEEQSAGVSLSPMGAANAEPAAAEPAAAPVEDLASLVERGKGVYATHCVACHQPNGQGIEGVFPALVGSAITTNDDPAQHIQNVLKGVPGTGMTPFGYLNDADLAAVITYERNAWGNDTGQVVTAADVAAAR